jgi:hypothetical protein
MRCAAAPSMRTRPIQALVMLVVMRPVPLLRGCPHPLILSSHSRPLVRSASVLAITSLTLLSLICIVLTATHISCITPAVACISYLPN